MSKAIHINSDGYFEEDPDIPMPTDAMVEKIKNFILATYEPASTPEDADVTMSTNEIYDAVMRLYPNEVLFSKSMLVNWLHEKGFTFFDAGKMRFEWLLKTAT